MIGLISFDDRFDVVIFFSFPILSFQRKITPLYQICHFSYLIKRKNRSATIWRLWKLRVEVGGSDGRGTGTHGNPNVPRTHMQIILGS